MCESIAMFASFVLCCFVLCHATASSPSQLQAKLQEAIDRHSSFWNTSMSFAIHNDTLEVAVASGRNNYGEKDSWLTVNTSIPMGSTTKMYSAVAVLRLAENGTLSLDQKVAPLVDKYLSVKLPCTNAPPQCSKNCSPIAHCLAAPKESSCKNITPEERANCSYCLRYLHCFCDGASCPSKVTLKMLWEGISDIEEVTFGQLLGMQSGLQDYYQDPTNWLMREVLSSPRTVEPLEYLAQMNHTLFFKPGSPRASYSTNGFSLVGLALAGLLNLTSWADLDQRSLAWGDQLFEDDQTLFPGRGTCAQDPRIAHQYTSPGTNKTFFDLAPFSCLNSWLGGNVAPRPVDVARFTYRVFTGKLLDQNSLDKMTSLHMITDSYLAGGLSYGLGLEGFSENGKPMPMQMCGMETFGHAGEDYGSGGIVNSYIPKLKLGVSFGVTAAGLFSPRPMGMNCSLRYGALARAPEMALNDLMNIVMKEAAGVAEPTCPAESYDIPEESSCIDAPSIGRVNLMPTTCSKFLSDTIKHSNISLGDMCDALGQFTLTRWKTYMKSKHVWYIPPKGYNPDTTTLAGLCKGTCEAVGAGPCWLRKAYQPWCAQMSSTAENSLTKLFI